MDKLTTRSIALLALLLCACSESRQPGADAVPAANARIAEAVYTNARVYTVDEKNSWAEAIAVSDGELIAVGTNDEINTLVGGDTRVHDLGGRMVMPGIHDMHVHPMEAGEKYNFQCAFPFTHSMEQIIAELTRCAAQTPKGEWIRGGQWELGLMESATVPHKRILDEITREHPIYLGDSTVHGAWVNSRALELLGINKETPDPPGGVILREPDTGEPTGVLIDNAAYDALRSMPAYSAAQYRQAISWAMTEMNKVGVTSIKDALAERNSLQTYKSLDSEGALSMRVSASIGWKMAWTDTRKEELESLASRADFASEGVGTNFVKIMLDGIPPTRTAAMLDPYVPDEKHGDNFLGKLIHSEEQLTQDMVYLDAQGLTVKIHATGDRSVRVALNAIEAARKANPGSSMRHEISHAELIHPDDIPRFRELDVVAELCPILWYPTPLVEVMSQVIGEERANRFWPIKDLYEAGAHLIYGSDWPSVVPDPSPWPGIEAMVSRRDPYGVRPGALGPEQALDLATVLRIFTINGAEAAKTRDRTGSLEVGKSADFIVLDRNLFEVPVEQVGDTQVDVTVVRGEQVYQRTQS